MNVVHQFMGSENTLGQTGMIQEVDIISVLITYRRRFPQQWI
jgi:hypothetical protein